MESKKTLNVLKGVQPETAGMDDVISRIRKARKKNTSLQEYVEGITASNRTMLSQAITLVESSLHKHQAAARKIIEKCLPHSGRSIRMGITGVPGVGKSTFIETFGNYLTSQGRKVAVLAIDPSSKRSGGSILGDKTRMEVLSSNPHAYIRPSPSGGSLGGVARKTRESIILCEAAGFDAIIIETVGVGQSETEVSSMVDFFLLLMLSGAGDELQGMKRGIMEMADLIAINKADGDNTRKAELARAEYSQALHLFPPSSSRWQPKVLTCSAVTKAGIEDIWKNILDYEKFCKANGYFDLKRNLQSKFWMSETVENALKQMFYGDTEIKDFSSRLENEVLEGRLSSFAAADQLLEKYLKKLKK
jgi:LAO/AO transport system kinase